MEYGFYAANQYGFNSVQGYGFTPPAGSVVVAFILYSDPFLYTLDANGNTLMTNADSFPDATVASGHGIELQVDNELPLDIPHTLGIDLTQTATSVGAGWVDNANDTYTGTLASTDIVGLSSLTSGVVQVEITLSSVTAGDVNGYTADGTYIFEETLSGTALALTGTGFSGTVSLA